MKTIIILIIIVILLIMLFNNKNENMNDTDINKDTNKDTKNYFTTKSNQAIQQLASMYHTNLLRSTKADIPIITSNNISANISNFNQINTDTINVKKQITSQRFCDQNNNCIDNGFLQRVNNTLANENVFFRNEMVVWDNLNEHVQKDIVSIPNSQNITYAISIKKLNNDKYILGIASDTIFEIQIPQVPENASYEYSVLWLQVEQSDTSTHININDIDYYISGNAIYSTPQYFGANMDIDTYTDINIIVPNNQIQTYNTFIVPNNQIQTYNTFINLQENINNNNFVWIPYIIKNLNQSKKIKISIKSKNSVLWISSIAFSSNPLNLSMNNINTYIKLLYAYNYYSNSDEVPCDEFNFVNYKPFFYIDRNRIVNSNLFSCLLKNAYKFMKNPIEYTIQDFIRDKKIPQFYKLENTIKIPYINSGKNKVLTLIKPNIHNSYINISIQTGINKYEYLPFTNSLLYKPLNIFFNQQFTYILLDKSMLNFDKNYINLKIEFTYYGLHEPEYFAYGYNTYIQDTFSWWPYYRYIKYLYERYTNITIIGTYDYLSV